MTVNFVKKRGAKQFSLKRILALKNGGSETWFGGSG